MIHFFNNKFVGTARKIFGKLLFWSGILCLLFPACKLRHIEPYPIEKTAIEKNAMVVSAHPLASAIGSDILKSGGNAVDAAVAVQFALAVVYPRAGNIGGGGFMVIRKSDGGFASLDYREKAPQAAHRDMYLDEEGNVIDSLSRYGHLSIGVPGTVDGLISAWEKYGRMDSFASLIDPAIEIAQQGFSLSKEEAERLNHYKKDFEKFNSENIPFIGKNDWKAGDFLVQEELANTLALIAEKGRAGFYKGKTAELISSQMAKKGGLMTKADLAAYGPRWRETIVFDYKNYSIASMPPPSSGGIALAQLLKMVEAFDLAGLGFHSAESIHLMAECARRVYADRAKYLGDSDFYPVPRSMLLDSLYIASKMENFDQKKATPSDSVKAGDDRIMLESFETTHTSVIDADRMAVSVTTTLNSNYGSKVVIEGGGFLMNNEMDDFSAKPGVANQFGLVGGEANAIEGGKRMLSSMTPTIAEKDGELFMVLGTPGGSTIITAVFQVFLNVVEFGMTMSEAVAASRFHHQWLPDKIITEKNGLDSLVIDRLKSMGHSFDEYEKIALVKAILVNEDGTLEGAGDPRSGDDVEGY